MSLKSRISWIILRRHLIACAHKKFHAHITSYADCGTRFSDHVYLGPKSNLSNVRVGQYSYIMGAIIRNAEIGRFCSVGPRSIIGGYFSHPLNYISTSSLFVTKRDVCSSPFGTHTDDPSFSNGRYIRIGHDCWIGADSRILDGVTIGHGAVVAAGALVTKDVEPYSIVGGVPAKIIRYRFDQSTRDRLLSVEWWNWSDTKIGACVRKGFFRGEVVSIVLDGLEKLNINNENK